jgi:P27 family predicted phage terminase small subunit
MRGRKALPKNVHKLHGSFREDRHGGGIQVAAVLPEPPERLPEVGQEEWRRIAPELHKVGLLSNLDLTALEMYCRLFCRWLAAEKELEGDDSLVMKTKTGYQAQSAYLNIANACIKQMQSIMGEFGMTPATRARMKAMVEQPKQLDLFDEFMGQKKPRQQNG